MEKVVSNDGTTIAYERSGGGPAVILVCGGSTDSQSNIGLANVLASDFTVFNYERRGRGASGDTPPYAVDREIEDIDAVVDAAGGSAALYGTSSGAALALEAALKLGGKIKKLVLWEPPYIVDPAARPPADQVEQYNTMIADGRRGDAAEYFMTEVVRMPPEFAAYAKTQPWWEGQKALAHTLAYDAIIMGDYEPPTKRVATLRTPTVIITGDASFPFMLETAEVLAKAIPGSETRTLKDQRHDVDPTVLGPVISEFLKR
jgi:pimeloyl-ACP methyl ester carboxylesterase